MKAYFIGFLICLLSLAAVRCVFFLFVRKFSSFGSGPFWTRTACRCTKGLKLIKGL